MHKNAKTFLDQALNEYSMSKDEVTLLKATAENLSVYWKAMDQLQNESLTITSDSGRIRKHPATEISKNSWSAFLAGCRLLQICQPQQALGGRGLKK